MAEIAWGGNAGLAYPLGMIRGLRLFFKHRGSTMIGPRAYAENLALIAVALRNPALNQGSVIECGTWRGGMSAGMIEMAGLDKNYHFFDSFEGLPPAGEHDGQKAKDYQRDTTSPTYYDNCSASLAEFEKTISRTGISSKNVGRMDGSHHHPGLPRQFSPPRSRDRLRPSPRISHAALELWRRAEHVAYRFARELEARGIGKGDKVVIWGENCAEWIAAFFGCLLRGAIVVPVDKIAAPDFAQRIAEQVDAKLCVGSPHNQIRGRALRFRSRRFAKISLRARMRQSRRRR